MLVTLYFFSWEATPLQHNLTWPNFFNASLIEQQKNKQTNKQTSWWYTFRLLNFIFHQLLIKYNSMTLNNLDIKVSALPSAPHVRLPANRYFLAFLQERIQNEVQRSKKSHVPSWEGAPKKRASIHSRKKWRKSPKKDKLIDFRCTWK